MLKIKDHLIKTIKNKHTQEKAVGTGLFKWVTRVVPKIKRFATIKNGPWPLPGDDLNIVNKKPKTSPWDRRQPPSEQRLPNAVIV